ncbi:MAG: DUF3617 family protein [Hyphomicrobium sp.]
MLAKLFAAACVIASGAAAAADGIDDMQDGAYEVVVTLDLPHLDRMGAAKTATICVQSPETSPTRGLAVLSENNPLGTCPASNIRAESNELKFEVHCAGKNAAEGFATYILGKDTFDGRIDMKMGGKNMTMSERQKGKRVGECADKPRS